MSTELPMIIAIVSRSTRNDNLSLSQGNKYPIIEIFDDSYRIVDEEGDPALYPKSYFLDDCEFEISPPDDWVCIDHGDGFTKFCPPEFSQRAFFDFHSEGDPEAVRKYREFCNKHGINLP